MVQRLISTGIPSLDDAEQSLGGVTQPSSRTSPGSSVSDSEGYVRDYIANPDYVAQVATEAYARIVEAWKLDDLDARKMLDVDLDTWIQIKNETWSGVLNQQQLMRISAIIGLYKALHSCFNEDLADRWIKRPNTGWIFSGRKPVDVMIEGGLPVMMKTRRYIIAG